MVPPLPFRLRTHGFQTTLLEVEARSVVISGGAIHTPAILLRSGLKHPMIGRHLCLHPVLVAEGVFPEDYREDIGDADGAPPQDIDDNVVTAADSEMVSMTKNMGLLLWLVTKRGNRCSRNLPLFRLN